MLDAFIIEEIKRQDEERRREEERPRPNAPVHDDGLPPARPEQDTEKDRGVIIIDYSI